MKETYTVHYGSTRLVSETMYVCYYTWYITLKSEIYTVSTVSPGGG